MGNQQGGRRNLYALRTAQIYGWEYVNVSCAPTQKKGIDYEQNIDY